MLIHKVRKAAGKHKEYMICDPSVFIDFDSQRFSQHYVNLVNDGLLSWKWGCVTCPECLRRKDEIKALKLDVFALDNLKY